MWVSKEQCEKARQYDVLSFLKVADPGELVKVSRNEYCLRSHDSFRISNGKWHWWSRDIKGHTAVDYLIEVKGYSFPSAVIEVLKVMDGRPVVRQNFTSRKFALPLMSSDRSGMEAYLREREIDRRLIRMMGVSGLVFEDATHRNIVFVGKDYDKVPRHAAYRAIDGSMLKGDVAGSDKRFCFVFPRKFSKALHVFEGPIDHLSYLSLCMMNGEDWESDDYLSVCGVHKSQESGEYTLPPALDEYLKHNKQLEQIFIHFDNDDVGASAARGVMRALEGKYEVINMPPPVGKDYNEFLKIIKNEMRKEDTDGRTNYY